MSSVPEARVNTPKEPATSMSVVEPVPVVTVRALAPAKSSTVASLAARLMSTDRPLPATVRPSMPTTATCPAEALKLDHSRGVATPCSLASTKAKLASLSDKPAASAVPALMPAKACKPVPPMVSRSVDTVAAVLPTRVCKLAVLRVMAKLPWAWKKPKALRFRLPLARSKLPSAPAMLKVS